MRPDMAGDLTTEDAWIADEGMIIVIMGVAASGKSLIAETLARQTGWTMVESDIYHPQANRKKMASGTPLTNADRMPWIDALGKAIISAKNGTVVVACSALNDGVRSRLENVVKRPCQWVLLDVPEEVLAERIASRKRHFMPASLLASQLEALELPDNPIRIDGTEAPSQICAAILQALHERRER